MLLVKGKKASTATAVRNEERWERERQERNEMRDTEKQGESEREKAQEQVWYSTSLFYPREREREEKSKEGRERDRKFRDKRERIYFSSWRNHGERERKAPSLSLPPSHTSHLSFSFLHPLFHSLFSLLLFTIRPGRGYRQKERERERQVTRKPVFWYSQLHQ